MDARLIDALTDRTYEVTMRFTEPLLGTMPTSSVGERYVQSRQIAELERELRRDGVAATAAHQEAVDRVHGLGAWGPATTAVADAPEAGEGEEHRALNPTGFLSDDQGLFLMDYVLKGMLKSVQLGLGIKVAGKGAGTSAWPTRDVQALTWFFGTGRDRRKLYLMRDGQHITEPDRFFDRPLRAQTPRGERVSIAVSEVLDPPVELTARLVCITGNRLRREDFERIFAYGFFQGMGQWRSGGFGRFDFELRELDGAA